jgi:hypothetical protein
MPRLAEISISLNEDLMRPCDAINELIKHLKEEECEGVVLPASNLYLQAEIEKAGLKVYYHKPKFKLEG